MTHENRIISPSPATPAPIVLGACVAGMGLASVFLLAHTRFAPSLGLAGLAGCWSEWLVAEAGVISLAWALASRPSDRSLSARRLRVRRRLRVGAAVTAWGSAGLLGEVHLRWRGDYSTWLERNGGSYASPYDSTGVAATFTLGQRRTFTLTQPEFSHEVVTNSLGLRDEEHPPAKPSGEYRVLALGDSFTMSQGAPLDDAWTRVLERTLNSVERTRRVRVLCAGVPGSDPVFGLRLLEERLLVYSPDLVLMVANASDVEDIVVRGGFERFSQDGAVQFREGPAWEVLFAHSHLVRFVVRRYGGRDDLLLQRDERERREAEAGDVLVQSARRLSELARHHGFEPMVVLHPMSFEVHAAETSTGRLWRLQIGERIAAQGVPVLDLLPLFRDRTSPESIPEHFWPIDHHCTPRGYRIFAEGVASRVEDVPGFPGARR